MLSLILGFVACIATYYFNDVFNIDRWDYFLDSDQARSALVGKSIAEGHGYKTALLPSAIIELYAQLGKLDTNGLWENSDRFPLTAYGVALIFKLFGTTNFMLGVVGYSFIFFMLSVVITYLLSLRISNNPLVGMFAVVLFFSGTEVMSTTFYKSADDIFYVLLGLYTYSLVRNDLLKVVSWKCVLLGIVIALVFLLRINLGLFFLVGVFIDFLISIKSERTKFKTAFLSFTLIIISLIIIILPYGIHTTNLWDIPFFTSNGTYQLSVYTPLQMKTDGWWKFHTTVGRISNFEILLNNPYPYIVHTIKFAIYNTGYLIADNFGILVAAIVSIVLKVRSKKLQQILPLLTLIIVMLVLNTITSGLLIDSYVSIGYFLWLMPLLAVLAADGMYNVYLDALKYPTNVSPLKNSLFISIKERASNLIVSNRFTYIFAILAFYYAYKAFLIITKLFGNDFSSAYKLTDYIIIICLIVLSLISVLFCCYKSIKRFSNTIVFCGLCVLTIVSTGPYIANKASSFYGIPAKTQSLLDVKEATSENGIILGFNGFFSLPWLTGKKAIGLPEYPHYIYEMIEKYKLPIDAIYLDDTDNWYINSPAPIWAPGYEIYPVINKTRATIPGFDLISYRSERDVYPKYGFGPIDRRISVYKKRADFNYNEISQPPKNYNSADTNKRINFVSGFGEYGIFDGRKVLYASDEIRKRYKSVSKSMKPWSDSEFVFYANDENKPKQIKISAYILGPSQVRVYLNLDFDRYDQRDNLKKFLVLDEFVSNKGWHEFVINLNHSNVVNGLNKIGFNFSNMYSFYPCDPSLFSNPQMQYFTDVSSKKCFEHDGDMVLTGLSSEQFENKDLKKMDKLKNLPVGSMFLSNVNFIY
jgi:hypothetical protein